MSDLSIQSIVVSEKSLPCEERKEILKEQSINIEGKRASSKQQLNNSSVCFTLPSEVECKFYQLQKTVILPKAEFKPETTHSVNFSIIDERDDLLISSTTIKSQKVEGEDQGFCELHSKPEDIICLADKVKICCFCALFGLHKDHSFKSEQQFLSQVKQKQSYLNEVQQSFNKMQQKSRFNDELRTIENLYQQKKAEKLNQIEEQYSLILWKINEMKTQTENKIRQEFNSKLRKIHESWKQCSSDLTNQKLFQNWKKYGQDVIANFETAIPTNNVAEFCQAYEQFPWEKGQNLLKEIKQKREEFVKQWKNDVQTLDLSIFTLKTSNKIKDSQARDSRISTKTDLSNTSIIEMNCSSPVSKTLIKTEGSCNVSLEGHHYRNSQKISHPKLKTIRQSVGVSPKQMRNSCYGMSKRKESYGDVNFSTFFNQSKQQLNISQVGYLSPKAKMQLCHSPRQSFKRQDGTKTLSQYEKNMNQTILSFANCGLEDEGLLYFLEKAFKSHIPQEINLSKNKISISGFVKLLPYFLKVRTVNLASTGLGQSCLDQLLKIKGSRTLEEINMMDNHISLHKNKQKIQTLKQTGLVVICQ